MNTETATISPTAVTRPVLSARFRVGLLLLAATAIGGLLIFEAAARVVFDRNGMHYGIEMWKYARLAKRQSENRAMGHEHVPNRSARLMGANVTINSRGLRNPEVAARPEPGVRRVLVLGDSMTFGWGVEEHETYPRVLEQMLNASGRRTEVINAGVGNYNTSQEVAWFIQRGLAYEPQEVILGFYINDAEPTPRKTEGWLASQSYTYVVASSAWDAIQRKIGVKKGYVDYYADLYDDRNPGWRQCQAALEELIRVCRARGIRLTIALLPELHDVEESYPFRFVHERVTAAVSRHDSAVLDLNGAFGGHQPKTLWVSPGDAHPNARAQRIIAERLFAATTAKPSTL
jgi:lysophospholipase L1-like esterase